jgi:hypothetical protein
VTTRLSLDRFEGKDKAIAVLVADDGATVNLPRSLLPPDAKAGDVLRLTLERDPEATREVHDKTARLQEKLQKTDPGGDIKL